MIEKYEIMDLAQKYNLMANIIEKDYILGWLLAGINNSGELSKHWIFKGGTCLKKCYFKEYRFSEDSDFTVIEIPMEKINFEEYLNPRGNKSVQGKITYKGPMQRKSNNPSFKIDLTNDEILVDEPTTQSIHHPYSDFVKK